MEDHCFARTEPKFLCVRDKSFTDEFVDCTCLGTYYFVRWMREPCEKENVDIFFRMFKKKKSILTGLIRTIVDLVYVKRELVRMRFENDSTLNMFIRTTPEHIVKRIVTNDEAIAKKLLGNRFFLLNAARRCERALGASEEEREGIWFRDVDKLLAFDCVPSPSEVPRSLLRPFLTDQVVPSWRVTCEGRESPSTLALEICDRDLYDEVSLFKSVRVTERNPWVAREVRPWIWAAAIKMFVSLGTEEGKKPFDFSRCVSKMYEYPMTRLKDFRGTISQLVARPRYDVTVSFFFDEFRTEFAFKSSNPLSFAPFKVNGADFEPLMTRNELMFPLWQFFRDHSKWTEESVARFLSMADALPIGDMVFSADSIPYDFVSNTKDGSTVFETKMPYGAIVPKESTTLQEFVVRRVRERVKEGSDFLDDLRGLNL